MSQRIFLVDDDAMFRTSVTFILEQAGYEVESMATGEEALEVARRKPPDLVLQDVGLPGIDGHEVLRQIREQQGDIPFIFLTARRRQADEVAGLELGADDFITKPFDGEVLLARIGSLLRRAGSVKAQQTTGFVVGDLSIDPSTRVVTVAGQSVDLPPRIFDLLRTLASHANEIVPIEKILEQVWGKEFEGENQAVYVHIRWLREKIEEDPNRPKRVVTVRGVGYRLVPH